jgi:hypothetical protein
MRMIQKVCIAALLTAPLVLGTVTASEAASNRGHGNSHASNGSHAERGSHFRKPSWKYRNLYSGHRSRSSGGSEIIAAMTIAAAARSMGRVAQIAARPLFTARPPLYDFG